MDVTIAELTKSFDQTPVLKNLSLEVAAGEFVSVLGPSGVGKTTFLRILAGLDSADSGRVHLGGVGIENWGAAQPAGRLSSWSPSPIISWSFLLEAGSFRRTPAIWCRSFVLPTTRSPPHCRLCFCSSRCFCSCSRTGCSARFCAAAECRPEEAVSCARVKPRYSSLYRFLRIPSATSQRARPSRFMVRACASCQRGRLCSSASQPLEVSSYFRRRRSVPATGDTRPAASTVSILRDIVLSSELSRPASSPVERGESSARFSSTAYCPEVTELPRNASTNQRVTVFSARRRL